MGRLFFSRAIHRSGTVSELARDESGLAVTFEWNHRRVTLNDVPAKTRTTGFLVIKDGRVVMERYYLGADENSLLTSWSVAKSFTSTLIGNALADGKITSVDDPITNYAPWSPVASVSQVA
jgi:CubicO group peptidase (beta-lactamase class C family)